MSTTERVERGAYSIAEVAQITGTSRKFVAAKIADGTLPAFRFGDRMWRVRADTVEALLRGEL